MYKRQAYDRSKKIIKTLNQNEEVEQVDEAGRMHSASAQQAGFKRIKDKESGGPGVGKVRSDDEIKKEKGGQAFLDRIAKAKAKMNKEEVEVAEADSLAAMQARREKRLAAQRKKMGTSSTGQDFGHDYGISSAERKKRQQAEFDKFVGRGKKTTKEEVEMKKDQKSDGRDTPTKVKLALARLRAKGMKVASPIVAPSNRDTAELPPLGEGINAYPASLRARTMGMSKADRQKHFDAYDAKKKGEEKKVSEGVVKKDYIGPLYAAWQDVIAGNSNTAAKFEEGIGIDQQMKISQDYNRMSPEEKLAANKKAMGNVKKVAPKKDTRTDAEKMTDAVGKPRMGSSD